MLTSLVAVLGFVAAVKAESIHVVAYTSDTEWGAGTDSSIHICLYGKNGDTGKILLDNSENNFDGGDVDRFDVYVSDVGTPTRLQVYTDMGGAAGAAWFLDKMEITMRSTGHTYTFSFYAWLDDDHMTRTKYVPTCGAPPTAPTHGDWQTEPSPYVNDQTAVLECQPGNIRSVTRNYEATITCRSSSGSSGVWSNTAAVCCPVIDHCESGSQLCTPGDNTCPKCDDNKVIFKPTQSDHKCEEMCSHDSDYCWPGDCSDELIRGCSCIRGFRKDASSTHTTCQPTTLPTIETCHTIIVGSHGERKRAMSRTSSMKCQDLADFYGNFQPVTVSSDIFTVFRVDISSATKPDFIHETHFGVTDVSLYLKRKSTSGSKLSNTTLSLLRDTTDSTGTTATFSRKPSTRVNSTQFALTNGQRLCIQYETKGGGYLKSKTPSGSISPPVPYQKTTASQELCYIYDSAPPEYCHRSSTCSSEPLHVAQRITRSPVIPVQFRDWVDPIPAGGVSSGASGIESYELTVHEVDASSVPLRVDTSNMFSKKVDTTETSMLLNLAINRPKLLCIALEVKDIADNVKQTRRFVLVDNTSFIEIDESKDFIVSSASDSTQYKWQTHHNPICLSWINYFYNRVYLDNPFLERIELAPNGLVTGKYDQITGQLPISGTTNVHGIVKYEVNWDQNNSKKSGSKIVSTITSQMACLDKIDMQDGDKFNLSVTATDIADNTLSKYTTLYIDRSVPHINNIWLVKDGYKRLFVHGTTDLSTMQLQYETLDPHSGLRTIEWALGTSDSNSELTTGHTRVQTIKEESCPKDTANCYCPDIGKCEVYSYVLPMNKLVAIDKHEGNHNRNYFFTLKVTNHAMLSNIEHLDILVDDSPPETGVVLEGPVGGGEIDYTSGDSLTVHWNGFIDHESGIKIYRVALARTCLDKAHFVNATVSSDIYEFKEVPYTIKALTVSANFTGKMFTTVVALNNAMEMSEPVCSDGVTRDINPPTLYNVTLLNAQWSDSLACENDTVWFIESTLTKAQLNKTPSCSKQCSGVQTDSQIPAILPASSMIMDDDKSSFLCETKQFLSTDNIIYLPHDNIYLTWDVTEAHSQVGDYHVGIGVSSSDSSSPTILSYHPTNKHQYYSKHHIGVGSDQTFYIFVKATNKAGLESIVTLGPVLVDETPPLFRAKPTVKIQAGEIIIGWQNDTFYDMEQKEPIHKIHFQFGHNGEAVSPMMEWVKNISHECPDYSGGCIKYPVARLQIQDTDLGLHFMVSLFVYNRAGHFTTVNTEPFMVPSKYPPGHAIVSDIDPANPSSRSPDIDVHMTNNTICARWTGFRHHENLTLEFAVGTSAGASDVIPFQPVTHAEYHCQTSPSILPTVKYFASVRASCSGGATVSSSDGVQVLQEDFITSLLHAQVGDACLQSNPLRVMAVNKTGSVYNLPIDSPLKLGYKYAVVLANSDSMLTLSDQDGKLENKLDSFVGQYYMIMPFVEQPNITLSCNSSCNKSIEVNIYKCASSEYFVPNTNIPVNWGYDTFESPDIHYRLSVHKKAANDTHQVSSFLTKGSRIKHTFLKETIASSTFQPGNSYAITVQPCIENACFGDVTTGTFTIESSPPRGHIDVAEITDDTKDCIDIHIRWKNFTCDSPVVLYQWAIVADVNTMQMMTQWRPGRESNGVFNIQDCTNLSAHSRRAMYICVRAFSETGTNGEICQRLDVNSLGEYASSTIYEFDTSQDTWNDIRKTLHSKPVGQTTVLLHNAELDFGTSNSKIVGAIAYGNDRNITWFLMGRRIVPSDCDRDTDCKYQDENNNDFVEIPTDTIDRNVPNYICAFSPATTTKREYFTETLDELRGCSNGFILDDTPPSPGKVTVANSGGYITDLTAVSLEWDSFTDNVDVTTLGYVHSMKYYSYALGSRPGGEDVANFTNVRTETSVLVNNITAKDGSTIYVTVKASDYAGLTTIAVSGELIVDTTPPRQGRVLIHCGRLETTVCTSYSLPMQLSAFVDAESGINSYDIDVGSSCGLSDVISVKSSRDRVDIDLQTHGITEGHIYCVNVKARNRANLTSQAASAQFVVDTSPPTGGHVLDGQAGEQMDVDYQTDVTHIAANWRGFEDVQSGLDYYRVGMGLKPYVDDIEAMFFVGLRKAVQWNTTFIPGHRYYTTVEACNQAGLCRSVVSDGVVLDNSPPIPGVVSVGSADRHSKFISSGSSVHIRWFGFEDPQSDIERFEACIGTVSGTCDILQFFPCLLQSNVIRTGLNLSSHQTYYATVRGYNKVGMSVTGNSDSFRIDSTPPEVITAPTFVTSNNSTSGVSIQWEMSLLKIEWQFRDLESPIINNIITLKTHHDGHTPIETLNVGPVNEVTLQMDKDKWLSDGDRYIAVITSCNAAGHCSSAESPDLLIDSTPPHLGGFKPPMTWHNFKSSSTKNLANVNLTWYGFYDEESVLETYFVSISRTYSGDELSNGIISVRSNETNAMGLAEQSASITLSEPVSPDDTLILSIWARNNAGLNSSVARVSVNVLSTDSASIGTQKHSGILELEKHSCDIHFCNKDCTCAVVGQPCTDVSANKSCISLDSNYTSTDNFPEIRVFAGLKHSNMNVTASSGCLTAHWDYTRPASNATIERFEWSMGILNQPFGEGIFDIQKQRPWNDVGQQTEIVYCLKDNKSLVHDEQYVAHVKVWFSKEISRIYTSDPIRIDQTPPAVRRGGAIKDSGSGCRVDFDFIHWMRNITACWKGVFRETQSRITHYTLALGTSEMADDVYSTSNVAMVQTMTINNLDLNHGTKYFITVTAYNAVGLHKSLSSDGFVVDMDVPASGVVFNTASHVDTLYQHSSTEFSISWHGFQDNHSGIKSYSVALVEKNGPDDGTNMHIDVGLNSSYTFRNLNLEHGKAYIGLVKATDSAGHVSTVSKSRAKVIDTTPPVGLSCSHFNVMDTQKFMLSEEHIYVGKYNLTTGSIYSVHGTVSNFKHTIPLIIDNSLVNLPVFASYNDTFSFEYAFVPEISGHKNISIEFERPSNESIEITIDRCEASGENNHFGLRVRQTDPATFIVQPMTWDAESSIYKILLGIGSSPGGFQVKGLSPTHATHAVMVHVREPHNTTLYFTAISENHAGLRSVFTSLPITIDKTPPTFRQRPTVGIEIGNTTDNNSVTVIWTIEDPETDVKRCYCALGRPHNTVYEKPFTDSDELDTCTFDHVTVVHGDVLLATVRCVNHVQLITEETSNALVIALERPASDAAKLKFISTDQGSTKAYSQLRLGKNDSRTEVQSNNTCLLFQWSGFSDLSGIKNFEYRLMLHNGIDGVWTSTERKTTTLVRSLSLQRGEVYTAEVRAANKGGFMSDAVLSNITISSEPRLTGVPIETKLVDTTLKLIWANVFAQDSGLSCLYDVMVGTRAGFDDVLDRQGLVQTYYDVTIGASMLTPDANELHIIVTCVSVTGESKSYTTTYTLV